MLGGWRAGRASEPCATSLTLLCIDGAFSRCPDRGPRGEPQLSARNITDDVDGMNHEPTCGGLNCLLRLQANTERQTELQQQAKSSQQALKGATAF